jgi:hypothetical protein
MGPKQLQIQEDCFIDSWLVGVFIWLIGFPQISEHRLSNISDRPPFLILCLKELFSDVIAYSKIYVCAISKVLVTNFCDFVAVGRPSSSHFVRSLSVLI